MRLDAKSGRYVHVQVQRYRLGDLARSLLAHAARAHERVCRAGALDGEAFCVRVVSPVLLGEAEVVQHAGEVEQLRVVLDAVALREELRERPCTGAVAVERWA